MIAKGLNESIFENYCKQIDFTKKDSYYLSKETKKRISIVCY